MLKYDKTDLLANGCVLMSGRGPYKVRNLIFFFYLVSNTILLNRFVSSRGICRMQKPWFFILRQSTCRHRTRYVVAYLVLMKCIYGNISWIRLFRFANLFTIVLSQPLWYHNLEMVVIVRPNKDFFMLVYFHWKRQLTVYEWNYQSFYSHRHFNNHIIG